MEQIEPRIGEEYLIFTGGSEKSFEGFYAGKKPVKTPWYQEPQAPEGHMFARRDEDGQIEIYCTREDKLQLWWNSDGEDGPEWPAGFKVSRVDIKLSELETKYLQERIDAWKLREAA